MENLKALIYKRNVTLYQRSLAKQEFEGLLERLKLLENALLQQTRELNEKNNTCRHDFVTKKRESDKTGTCDYCGESVKI